MFAFLGHFVLGHSTIFAVVWGLFQSFKIWGKKDIYKKFHKMLAKYRPHTFAISICAFLIDHFTLSSKKIQNREEMGKLH